MKALRTKICTYAIALLLGCGFNISANAGSSDFAGIFAAVHGSAGGAQIHGTHTDQSGETTRGNIGGIVPLGGYELGFNLPLGDVFFIGVGHHWTPSGSATLAEGVDNAVNDAQQTGEDAGAQADYTLKAKNLKSIYLMPSVSIYDNSAIYVKIGRSIADLDLTGAASGTPIYSNGYRCAGKSPSPNTE